MLIGHSTRPWAPRPNSPVRSDGTFVPHTGKPLSEMEQVFDDFSADRSVIYTPLPDSVPWFIISPALNVLNPHRELIKIPDDAVLVPETDFMGHKTGGSKAYYLALFKRAQKVLGKGLTLAEYEADADEPETSWVPTPQDEELWNKTRATMIDMHARIIRFLEDNNRYPNDLDELRPYYRWYQLPMDPFLADHFEYRLTDDGFTLYCYGKDWKKGDSDDVPYQDIVIDQNFED